MEEPIGEQSMAPYLRRLKRSERQHITGAMALIAAVDRIEHLKNFHAGMLPMVKVADVVKALSLVDALYPDTKGGKMRATIKSRLKTWAAIDSGSVERFKIALDDAKVVKRYGKNLAIGIPLRGHTKRVTAGLKWSLPKKGYVPDEDTTVLHHFTMRKLKGPYWEVAVNHRFKDEVTRCLIDTCL